MCVCVCAYACYGHYVFLFACALCAVRLCGTECGSHAHAKNLRERVAFRMMVAALSSSSSFGAALWLLQPRVAGRIVSANTLKACAAAGQRRAAAADYVLWYGFIRAAARWANLSDFGSSSARKVALCERSANDSDDDVDDDGE